MTPSRFFPVPPVLRRLGLLGGGGEAIAYYKRKLFEECRHRYGQNARANLVSLNLHTPELVAALESRSWPEAAVILNDAISHLEALGAEAIVPCGPELVPVVALLKSRRPVIHATESAGRALCESRARRVGLIGTRESGGDPRWREDLGRFGIVDVFLPVPKDREYLAAVLLEELSQGLVREDTRADMNRIVYSLRQAGARGLLLARPEFELLFEPPSLLPLYSVFDLHVAAALQWALPTTPPHPPP